MSDTPIRTTGRRPIAPSLRGRVLLAAGGIVLLVHAGAAEALAARTRAASAHAAPADASTAGQAARGGAQPAGGSTAARPGAQPASDAGTGQFPIDRVVAVVNTEAITGHELASRIELARRRLEEERQPMPSSEQLQQQVLEQMIVSSAMMQYAREIGVAPGDAEVDRAIDEVSQRNNLSLDSLRRELAARGVEFDAYRRQVANDIVLLRLRDREALARVQVSEAEIDAFEKKSGAASSRTGAGASANAEYDIAQILLKTSSEAPQAEQDATGQQAAQLLAQLQAGADFAELARARSQAPESLEGGDLGWRPPQRIPQLFLDAVASLKPGEIAPQVLRSPAGFHILKLLGRRQAEAATAAAAGPAVRATHVRHILLPATDAATERESRRRLDDFRRRIVSGQADFESLARQYSVDGSASQGGDVGWVHAGDLVQPFEQAMDQLAVDALSEPVKTQFGVHLIQVTGRRDEQPEAAQGRDGVRRMLREQKANEAFEEWARELRDRTYVDLRLDPPAG